MLSDIARFYRGGFEVCFKFIKTGFHAGSLCFSYNIGPSFATVTLPNTDPLHRTVVDLQDGESVCLSFPFISINDWLTTSSSYGRFYVHVVNPLVAPETVAQSVSVLVYVRGMEDLEFSGWNHQDARIPQVSLPIVPQIGQGNDTGEIICQPIGGSLEDPPLTGLQMMDAMSESITSVLQYLKGGIPIRFSAVGVVDPITTWAFNPSAWGVRGRDGAGAITQPPIIHGNVAYIKSCYAFQRGGYELNVLPSTSVSSSLAQNAIRISSDYFLGANRVLEPNPPGPGTGITFDPSIPVSTAAACRNYGPISSNLAAHGLSATVPYRSLYRVNVIFPCVGDASYGDPQLRVRFNVTTDSSATLLLRPGEDFQLLYWVGVPPRVSL
jgi:hypothetical protein